MEMVLTEKFLVASFNTVAYWAIALVLMVISYFVMDKILLRRMQMHLTEQLEKGNIAVAIFMAAFMGAIGLVIFGVTN